MCTVTFIPVKTGCFITSNRDEKHWRKAAIPPKRYKAKDGIIVYPKDGDAGGTWIALKDNGDAAVLLNGAFKKHTPAPPYNASRGLIFLDIAGSNNPTEHFANARLDKIEPFTLVIWCERSLHECRWDGTRKFHQLLNSSIPHIWSSATLYDEEVVKRREQWFRRWLETNKEPSQQAVLDFHHFGGDGDNHNDVRMNRDGLVYTVSITGIQLLPGKGAMTYIDLRNNEIFKEQIDIAGSYSVAYH